MIANTTTYSKLQEDFKDCNVVFSVFDTVKHKKGKGAFGDNWIVSDRRMEVAVKGKCKFVCKHDDFWGEGKDYESEVLENPIWLSIGFLAEAMILTTGDYHHRYLEGIKKLGVDDDGVLVYEFVMGS